MHIEPNSLSCIVVSFALHLLPDSWLTSRVSRRAGISDSVAGAKRSTKNRPAGSVRSTVGCTRLLGRPMSLRPPLFFRYFQRKGKSFFYESLVLFHFFRFDYHTKRSFPLRCNVNPRVFKFGFDFL